MSLLEDSHVQVNSALPSGPLTYEQLGLIANDVRAFGAIGLRPLWLQGMLLKGRLNVCAMQKSLEEIIRRHSVLRTKIVRVEGILHQFVDEYRDRLHVLDLRHARNDEMVIAREINASFEEEEAKGKQFVVRLVILGHLEHIFAWAHDEVILDQLSVNLMFQEFWRLYMDFVDGRPPPLRDPAPQYIDYALLQQRSRDSWQEKHGSWWNACLAGASALEWPNYERQIATDCDHNGVVDIHFDQNLTVALRELGSRVKVPLATVVLSVFVLVLSETCNQRDIVIPITIAGQHGSEQLRSLGYFAFVSLLRVLLTGHESCLHLIGKVSGALTRVLAHEDQGRVALLRPELAWTCVFSWCSWRPGAALGLPSEADSKKLGLAATRFPLQRSSRYEFRTPFDVDVTLYDKGEDIAGYALYRTNALNRIMIMRIAEKFRTAALHFVSNPLGRAFCSQ